ncbi:M10 family metallopeptidase C-terminal domain-containing protein [Inquilinus sp. CA228]|uniref:M10 family metallopeptidase C-terminal domain-containing protein n=1 Tax=Inquilinus sp. CA228 TaxID=3455609 RepID=UPI003F8D47CB
MSKNDEPISDDMLTRRAGPNRFVYVTIGDSTVASQDAFRDFASGDKIDPSAIRC